MCLVIDLLYIAYKFINVFRDLEKMQQYVNKCRDLSRNAMKQERPSTPAAIYIYIDI